jgi:hypothetical protein
MHKVKIQYINRIDINENAWNHVVRHSPFNRVYAYTWFLDHMSDQAWSGIVIGDYEAVFPLLIKTKLLLKYITTPPLCQQLGLFMLNDKNSAFYLAEIQKSLKSYLKTELTLHHGSGFANHCVSKTNHILPLNRPYEILKQGYNRNTIRNINAAKKTNVNIVSTIEVHAFLDFVLVHEPSGSVKSIYTQLHHLVSHTLLHGNGHIIEVHQNGKPEAVAYYIEDPERIYFLVCASTDKGKEMKLMYLLIDHLIKTYADTNKVLDFTGSNIPSIARRNLGFGATAEAYYFLKMKIFD